MLPVPVQPPQGPDAVDRARRRGEIKDRIVQLLARADDEVWGSEGSFEQGIVTVPREDLWSNPIYPFTFTQAEIVGVADSLRTLGQRSPITVMKAPDPRTDIQGGTGGKYLIVDVDGELLWRASFHAGRALESLRVRFVRYDNLFYAARDTLTMATTRQQTTDEQYAILFLRARRIYEELRSQSVALPAWPKQVEWAAYLGRDQSTISRWEQIARVLKDQLARDALDHGQITIGQLREAVDLPAAQRSDAITTIIDQNRERGTSGPLSKRETREVVRDFRPGAQWVTDDNLPDLPRPSAGALYLPQIADYETVKAFSILLHDLRVINGIISAAMSEPNRAIRRIDAALSDPDVKRLIERLSADS